MIQKDEIYCSGDLKFVNFISLSESLKEEVLDWRNNELITKWMFDKNTISLTNHLKFIESLKTNNQKFYWLAFKGEKSIGVINLIDYNEELKSAEWGFYLNPALFMSNLGFELFHEAIQLFFGVFKMKTLFGFVQIDNKNALILNSFFGMKHIHFEMKDGYEYSARKMTNQDWKENSLTLKEARKNFIPYIRNNGK